MRFDFLEIPGIVSAISSCIPIENFPWIPTDTPSGIPAGIATEISSGISAGIALENRKGLYCILFGIPSWICAGIPSNIPSYTAVILQSDVSDIDSFGPCFGNYA